MDWKRLRDHEDDDDDDEIEDDVMDLANPAPEDLHGMVTARIPASPRTTQVLDSNHQPQQLGGGGNEIRREPTSDSVAHERALNFAAGVQFTELSPHEQEQLHHQQEVENIPLQEEKEHHVHLPHREIEDIDNPFDDQFGDPFDDRHGIITRPAHSRSGAHEGDGGEYSGTAAMSGTAAVISVEGEDPSAPVPTHKGYAGIAFEESGHGGKTNLQVLEIEEIETIFRPYKISKVKTYVYYILLVLTCGLLYLVARWFPKLRAMLTAVPSTLEACDLLLVENTFGDFSLEPVLEFRPRDFGEFPVLRFVNYRYIRFIYDPKKDIFVDNQAFYDPITEITDQGPPQHIECGLLPDRRNLRKILFDENLINIEEKSIPKLLVDEILHPFYIFQVYSIIVWGIELYYYYATAIGVVSIISIISALIDTRKNLARLREMAKFSCDVEILTDNQWSTQSSVKLVPGDIFKISPNMTIIPCDFILVSGSCLVDESMLTGESIPVSKVPLIIDDTTTKELAVHQKKHHLSSGTRIIRVKAEKGKSALGMVVKTGFNTVKGSLIRSILFPKPNKFKFHRDSFRFIAFIGVLAMLGFFYSLYYLIKLDAGASRIILRACDLVTIAVPPALPVAMTIGTTVAIKRLQRSKIFCISPPRVNVSGKLNIMCFDKTGTLTEDGLTIKGVACIQPRDRKMTALLSSMEELYSSEDFSTSEAPKLSELLATCHSIKEINGKMLGDPIDLRMHEFTNWTFEECPSSVTFSSGAPGAVTSQVVDVAYVSRRSSDERILITKCFEFESALQRMSVVTQNTTTLKLAVHCKGSPELIASLCIPSSVPANFHAELNAYTLQGLRVIACASKHLSPESCLDIHSFTRKEAEKDLVFKGLIVLENRLKAETAPSLKALRAASFRNVMITGDNLLTAIAVAREAAICRNDVPIYRLVRHFDASKKGESGEDDLVFEKFDHFWTQVQLPIEESSKADPSFDYELALSGDDYQFLKDNSEPSSFHKILMKCQIYARMTPDLKKALVEEYQGLGYCAGMCGDGANDCGALRAADVGLSLSETEASVAAPFTSRNPNISAVLRLIREGRAALVTSLSCFKYMALYAMIQTCTCTILYSINSNLADFQFLYIDLILILPLALCMALTSAYEAIVVRRPIGSLMSPRVSVSLFGQILLQVFFQAVIYVVLQQQSWYLRYPPVGSDYTSYDNTTLFLFSIFQYISGSIVFSVGKPFRKPLYTNGWFLLVLVILMSMNLYMVLYPAEPIRSFMQIKEIDWPWKFTIIGFAGVHFIVASIFETWLFPPLARALSRYLKKKLHREKKPYKAIGAELAKPRLTEVLSSSA